MGTSFKLLDLDEMFLPASCCIFTFIIMACGHDLLKPVLCAPKILDSMAGCDGGAPVPGCC